MPPIAKEQKGKYRVPEQRVRAGRGKPGYKGGSDLIDVYKVPDGKSSIVSPVVPDEDDDGLEGKTRAELDDIASGLGLDPENYGNKGKVIEAIRANREE
jgi:hypothetical protein